MSGQRVAFLDLTFDLVDIQGVCCWLDTRTASSDFAYVVTPNVDHVVRLAGRNRDVRPIYAAADLCLCDSRILARLARLFAIRLTIAPGSDLVAAVFARSLRPGDRACIIGSKAEYAAKLQLMYPTLTIIHHQPPMGLRDNVNARNAAVLAAASADARIIFLAVGSPQQELLASEMRISGQVTGTALCIGASIELLIGAETRAPRLVQQAGMEWAWRLIANPRRLARRYLIEGPAILPILYRWSKTSRKRQ